MFVERDTGARNWSVNHKIRFFGCRVQIIFFMSRFGVPLVRALEVFNQAYQNVSGLARTVRGPSMSCTPGKVCVIGSEVIAGEKVFVLKFLQGRNPAWTDRVFFAQ